MFEGLENYRILLSGLFAWWLAQFLKVPFHYMVTRHWNWALWFSTGGMPSSHSALVTSMSMAIGLWAGFDSPSFAISVALAMIVVYDAAGVRRQAGMHAQRLNHLVNELFSGQPISEMRLKEVLGHTPRQVLGGVLLGIVVPTLIWLIWR
jgi:uncharacterized protein